MKGEEFNLSEKIWWVHIPGKKRGDDNQVISFEDIKEFIKRLKEEFKEHHWIGEISHKIDKLAGDKL